MNEVRRFLRYVLPGLGFFIEIFLYLLISAPEQVITNIKAYISFTTITGSALALFVGSGGVGYLFSTVHHVLFHRNWSWYPRVDKRNLINIVQREGLLLLPVNFTPVTHLIPTLNEAWSMCAAVWHERIEVTSLINSINPHNETLSDIMHGSGASYIGSFIAIFFFAFLSVNLKYLNSWCSIPFWAAFVIALAMNYLHRINYKNSCEHFQRVTDTAFADALRSSEEGPVTSNIIRGQDL